MIINRLKFNNKMCDVKNSIKLSIKNMNIIGSWTYNTENKDCGICENDLLIPSQSSAWQSKINSSVVIGACKHGFHEGCMNRWISCNKVSCPICRTTWKANKNVGGTVYLYKPQ